MKLNIVYKECFEAMWNWLADNPIIKKGEFYSVDGEIKIVEGFSCKKDWPGYKTLLRLMKEHKIIYDWHYQEHCCFACLVVINNCPTADKLDCAICPVDFWVDNPDAHCYNTGEGCGVGEGKGNPKTNYQQWNASETKEDKSKYARLIARGWKNVDLL
jgi:hypothetical protein